jgi:hypothetical protein
MLRTYRNSPRTPDALLYRPGFFAENPDSAGVYYSRVATSITSARAPVGCGLAWLLAERRDNAGAKDAYQRVVQKYPSPTRPLWLATD